VHEVCFIFDMTNFKKKRLGKCCSDFKVDVIYTRTGKHPKTQLKMLRVLTVNFTRKINESARISNVGG
jgi:hypothetical protein